MGLSQFGYFYLKIPSLKKKKKGIGNAYNQMSSHNSSGIMLLNLESCFSFLLFDILTIISQLKEF